MYTDASRQNSISNSTSVSANDPLYGKLEISFDQSETPSTEHGRTVKYALPGNVVLDGLDNTNTTGTLYDKSNNVAGTWELNKNDNAIYLHYDETWTQKNPTGVLADVNFQFKLAGNNVEGSNDNKIHFPGTTGDVTVPVTEGDVSGSKSAAFDSSDNTILWTVRLNPATDVSNLTVSDTIGSNLSFVEGSFSLKSTAWDAAPQAVTPAINGQSASISLGTLSSGSYDLTYKTSVNNLTTDANGNLSDSGNTADWTWGSTNQHKPQSPATANPPQVSTNMLSKSAAASGDNIAWTIKLNSGTIKADMAGYKLSDTLQNTSDQEVVPGTYTISGGGKSYTVTLSEGQTSFDFSFPEGAGKSEYALTYNTKMKDGSTAASVKNDAELAKGDETTKVEATFVVPDTTDYIDKAVADESKKEQGVVSWKSTLHTSKMSANTQSLSYEDTFNANGATATASVFGNVAVATADGAALTAGTDYTVTYPDWSNVYFSITFTSTGIQKLAGKADAVVTYTTTNPNSANGTYTNKGTVKHDNASQDDVASYTLNVEKTPQVLKGGKDAKWDANYDWGGGAKGAWLVDWTVTVNRAGKDSDELTGSFNHKPVVVADTLPEGMSLAGTTASYSLHALGNSKQYYNQGSVTASVGSDGKVAFSIPTDKITYSWGTTDDIAADWVGYIELTYQTAIKASDAKLPAGKATTFTNKASAVSGSKEFPEGTGDVTINNKVLDKTSKSVSSDGTVRYTINVNPSGLDLASGSDTLTVVDTMSSKGIFIPDTFKVLDAGGANDDTAYANVISKAKERGIYEDQITSSSTVSFSDKKKSAEPVAATAKIDITKTVNGANPQDDEQFSFQISAKTEGAPMPTNTTVTTKGAGAASFEGLAFTEAGAYEYTIHETTKPAEGSGWTNAGDITAKVVVTKALDGSLSAAVDYTGSAKEDSYVFNNTYAPAAKEVGIKVSKAVNGDNPTPNEEFEFTLYGVKGNELTASLGTVKLKGGASGSFTGVKVTEAGTYKYKIKESAKLGWTNEAGDIDVTVKVSDDRKGALSVDSIEYSSATTDKSSALFTNKYTGDTTADVTISVNKKVAGDNPQAGEKFTFGLYKANEDGSRGDKVAGVDAITLEADQTKAFEGLKLGEGTHKYIVHETSNNGAGWTNAQDVTATVTVARDQATGKLSSTVTYSTTNAEKNAAFFENTYKAPAPAEPKGVSIDIKKTVNGENPQPGETFTFQLQDENGKKVEDVDDVTTNADGEASFKGLTFTEAGKHSYKIHETSQDGNGWTNASDFTVTVTVTDDGKGNLTTSVDYNGTGKDKAFVDNKYEAAPATATISVNKKVAGDKPKENETFTFELRDEDGNAVEGIDAIELKADETKSFSGLKFTKAGTYAYVIHETSDNGDGWKNAQDVTATVTVTDDRKGSLHASVEYKNPAGSDATNAAFFENEYHKPQAGVATISVNKKVAGDHAKADEKFTFELQDKDGKAVEGVKTIELVADETKSFEGLSFNEAGNFTYKIHETSVNGAGWTNAQDVAATVHVTYNEKENRYETSVEYSTATEDKNAAFFENKFEAVSTTLDLSKEIAGDDAQETETFEFAITPQNGAPAPEKSTVTTTGAGTASFGNVYFNEKGVYEYVISETGKLATGWSRAGDVTATVTVGEADGKLVIEKVVYSNATDDAKAAKFVNTYTAAKVTLNVTKAVVGTGASASRRFTFTLFNAKDDGSIGDKVYGVDAVVLKAKETKSFTMKADLLGLKTQDYTLRFDKEGTYTYWISETSKAGTGWTNAPDVKVTVTVTKGENNEFVTKVEYSKATEDGKSALFENKYEKTGTGSGYTPKKSTTPSTTSKPGNNNNGNGNGNNTKGKTSSGNMPKTGDDYNDALVSGLAVAGVAALVGGVELSRRNRKRNE